jgi:type I restriction-modification system DNA methylase subunit
MEDITTFISLFEQYAYAQSYATAFEGLLDYFMTPFKFHENNEDLVKALTQIQTHPKKDLIVPLLTSIGELSEGFNDPLGTLFEQLISKGQKGQFFTPEPIMEFMASSVIAKDMEPGQTVCDPACGSGRMLLAAAKINRHLHFYGADIDPICSKMAVVNMLLNSLTGEIAHMNSLSNEFYSGYKLGTMLKDGYHYPYYIEFTNPEESYIWLRPTATSKNVFETPFETVKSPLMSEGIQGRLFDL